MRKLAVFISMLLLLIAIQPFENVWCKSVRNSTFCSYNEEESVEFQTEKRLVNQMSPIMKVAAVFASAGIASGIILIIMKNKGVEEDE